MLGQERGTSEGRWRRRKGRFLLLVISQGEGETGERLLESLLLLSPHVFVMAAGGRLATTAVPLAGVHAHKEPGARQMVEHVMGPIFVPSPSR